MAKTWTGMVQGNRDPGFIDGTILTACMVAVSCKFRKCNTSFYSLLNPFRVLVVEQDEIER